MMYLLLENDKRQFAIQEYGSRVPGPVTEFSKLPKRGQFWVNRHNANDVVFVTSVYNMSPETHGYYAYRGVAACHLWNSFYSGYEISAKAFLQHFKPIDCRSEILENLRKLMRLMPDAKKAHSVLRSKELNLTDEEKGMFLLGTLDD